MPSLKLLDYDRKKKNDVHIDTYYCKAEPVSCRKINITVFYTRYLSSASEMCGVVDFCPADQKCAGSSMYWQFFYYRLPGKLRNTAGEIAKMWCQELDIYTYMIYKTPSLSISIGNTRFHTATWTCLGQFGAAANFGDRRQIRQSQMFIKLAFEFGCDVVFMSHPITRSLGSKLR